MTEIALPKLPARTGWDFQEVARRHGDFALAAVAVTLTVSDGVIAQARIALTGVGPTALRAADAEALLVGRKLEPSLTGHAIEDVRAAIEPDTDLHASSDYRRHLAGVLLGRALNSGLAPRPGMRGMIKTRDISVTVNGTLHAATVEPRLLLADFLRHGLGLTGTHVGCEHGVCGACTVLLDGDSARSCLMFAVQADGRSVETVESLGRIGQMNALQESFHAHHALQCGFCTPGMLMTATDLLKKYPLATDRRNSRGAFRQSLPLHRL